MRRLFWLIPLFITIPTGAVIGDGVYSLPQPVTGSLSVSNWPGSYPGPATVTNWPSVFPVTGTFWQTTQPVSGTVAVSNFPATQAVSGTFWQAIQPVSITSMPSTPVTGTFWQSVQPVSGQVSVSNFPGSATSAVVSRITVGTSAVVLAAANSARHKVIVFNETGTLRVKLGPNASLTDYTYEILASAGNNRQDIDGYSGVVSGIKVSGITSVQVTEF